MSETNPEEPEPQVGSKRKSKFTEEQKQQYQYYYNYYYYQYFNMLQAQLLAAGQRMDEVTKQQLQKQAVDMAASYAKQLVLDPTLLEKLHAGQTGGTSDAAAVSTGTVGEAETAATAATTEPEAPAVPEKKEDEPEFSGIPMGAFRPEPLMKPNFRDYAQSGTFNNHTGRFDRRVDMTVDRDTRVLGYYMDRNALDQHTAKKAKPDISRKKKKVPLIIREWKEEIEKEKYRFPGPQHY